MTTNLGSMKSLHKSLCNSVTNMHRNIPLYTLIRDNGGWCNWDIDVIERGHWGVGEDAIKKRKLHWIDRYKPALSMSKTK